MGLRQNTNIPYTFSYYLVFVETNKSVLLLFRRLGKTRKLTDENKNPTNSPSLNLGTSKSQEIPKNIIPLFVQ